MVPSAGRCVMLMASLSTLLEGQVIPPSGGHLVYATPGRQTPRVPPPRRAGAAGASRAEAVSPFSTRRQWPVAELPPDRRTAGYLAQPHEVHRVVLLYSGGLDTSVMLKWIQDQYDAEVVALCVDLGQPDDDLEAIRRKALDLGAVESLVVDAKSTFAHEYVAPAIRANARYQGGYPLFTSLGRPLLARLAVEAAREQGADTIAHGCTGEGNDQVRIEATVLTLAPELKVIAPVREWQMGRDEEIAYAHEHGIPVASTAERPYSIDDNLWGRSSEGGVIEDLG